MQTRALQIALATPNPRGHRGIPVLLWGAPGVGKTTIVEQIAEQMGLMCQTIIASIHDPTDFSGLPVQSDDRVKFLPPEWFIELVEAGDGILFADELTTAPAAVQAALLRLVNERRLGAYTLPKGVAVVAAANPPEIGGNELSEAMANRFVHLSWNLTAEQFVEGFTSGWQSVEPLPPIDEKEYPAALTRWKSIIAALIHRNSGLLQTRPGENEFAFASPRSWEFLARLAATAELVGDAKIGQSPNDTFATLIIGTVGTGAGLPFIQFVKQIDIPDPHDLLDGKVPPPQLSDDSLFVLGNEMYRICSGAANMERWRRYFELSLHYKHQGDIYLLPIQRGLKKNDDNLFAALRTLKKEVQAMVDEFGDYITATAPVG